MRPEHTPRYLRAAAVDFFAGLTVFLVVLAIAALDAREAHPSPAIVPAAQVDRDKRGGDGVEAGDVGTGTLLLRPARDGGAGALTPAPRLGTDVRITVTGPIARTVVVQRFRNTGMAPAGGVYAIPLPRGAAVDTLSMETGERTIRGRITPRREAAFLYGLAGQAGPGSGPSLQQRPNVFIGSLEEIASGETITVRAEYQQLLRRNGEAYTLRFPLVVAPRYAPKPHYHVVRSDGRSGARPGGGDAMPPAGARDAERLDPVSLQVTLDAGFPLGEIRSNTHAIEVRRDDTDTAHVSLARTALPRDRDFELTWRAGETAGAVAAAFRETGGSGGYVMTTITPPRTGGAPEAPPRELVFVVDTSGSMAGAGLTEAKVAIERGLKHLRPGDRFNILRFAGDHAGLFGRADAASPDNLAQARDYLAGLEAEGGTKMLPALTAALRDPNGKSTERLRQIVMLTDGSISNEAELLSAIAAGRGRSRLFLVGLGAAPNGVFLRRAAEIGRGDFIRIENHDDVRARMAALFERLARPVITDLKIEWPAGTRADAWPDPLPDLYAGEPLVVTARVSALKGALTMTGTMDGKPWKQTLALSSAAPGTGVGQLWARRKIASLETRRYAGQAARDVDAAIQAVALEHRLVSRMTRLVLFDETPPQPGPGPLASEELPYALPAGRVYNTIFGGPERTARYTALPQKRAGLPASLRAASGPAQTGPDAGSTGQARAEGTDPGLRTAFLEPGVSGGGAKPAGLVPDRTLITIVMGLFFAVMTALTLGLWRHLRREYVAPRRTGSRI